MFNHGAQVCLTLGSAGYPGIYFEFLSLTLKMMSVEYSGGRCINFLSDKIACYSYDNGDFYH